MHELGIVFHIMKGVETVAAKNRLTQIASVTIELGQVSAVIPHYLTDCWEWAVAKSRLLQDARLMIEEIPAVTYCEDCRKTYDTVTHGKICPHCGSANTYLLQGNEVNIKEIEAC